MFGNKETFYAPGVIKKLNVDGEYYHIKPAKIKLGKLKDFVQIVESPDIYNSSMILKFYMNNTQYLNKNYTISFQLESSNGLKSNLQEFDVKFNQLKNFTEF